MKQKDIDALVQKLANEKPASWIDDGIDLAEAGLNEEQIEVSLRQIAQLRAQNAVKTGASSKLVPKS